MAAWDESPLKRLGKEGALDAEPLVLSGSRAEHAPAGKQAAGFHGTLLFVLCGMPAPLLKQSADGIVPMLMQELAERFPRVAHEPAEIPASPFYTLLCLCSTDPITLTPIYPNEAWCMSQYILFSVLVYSVEVVLTPMWLNFGPVPTSLLSAPSFLAGLFMR